MMSIRRVHPGVYIKDELDAREMTSKEFSIRSGISERMLSYIINGGSITFDVAYKLSTYFGNSIDFWTNLQNAYDLYQKEEEIKKGIEEDWKLVKIIKQYLINHCYINNDDTKEDIVKKARQLADVNNLTNLCKKDAFVILKEQKGQNRDNDFYQNFWLALALNEARKRNSVPYNKEKLKTYLPDIRKMITQDPSIFSEKMDSLFMECGISFVLLPYLTKSDIYGATKWFSKDNVMLAVSNRSESADLFWFTIFHEISHVLMEHRRETLINARGIEDEEADQMAADLIIPRKDWDAFIKQNVFTEYSIRKFAKQTNVLPCIVVGRLHKEKHLKDYGHLDKVFRVSYIIETEA